MKKYLSFILAALMIMAVSVSCMTVKKPDEPAQSSAESVSSPESTPDVPTASTPDTPTEPTTEPEPEIVLPSSSTLDGTVHMPNVDSQGSIGSCTSEGVTFAQFTIAVSQYMHSIDPDTDWNPSTWNAEYIFSPKYTFNFSGPSTEGCYKVLRDNGCLPMSVCVCEKSRSSNPKFWGGSNIMAEKSRAWEVGEGMMLRALKFRITNFSEVQYQNEVGGKLTTSEQGLQLIKKVKEAIFRGNAVASCGWSSFWEYTTIDDKGLGTLGKRGQSVIWNGYKVPDTSPDHEGNHCIALIGYDDDITCMIAGVTLKGAFLVRNSWGSWQDEGNCWMMYDAFNKVSEHAIFNDPSFYKTSLAVSVKDEKAVIPYSSRIALSNTFSKVDELTLGENVYPVYTINCGKNYLAYSGALVTHVTKATEKTKFAIIPYKEVTDTPDENFKNCYVFYAVNTTGEARYLSVKDLSSNTGLKLTDSLEEPEKVCFRIHEYNKSAESFTGLLCTQYTTNNTVYERTGTMYSFSFLYWDADIAVGLPDVSVEAEVTGINRNNLNITLTRTDKNGVQKTYCPACVDLRLHDNLLPDLDLKQDETLSFSGKSNPTEAETGFFAFGYMALMDYDKKLTADDFLWGVNIRGMDVTVKSLKLIDKDGNVISKITLPEDTPAFKKGEMYRFIFDQGKEIKPYVGTGTYILRNVGTGKQLSLSDNFMTFEWAKGKKPDPKQTNLSLDYDKEHDQYFIRRTDDNNFVLDIRGTDVKDGVMVKMNAQKDTRNTQGWKMTLDDKGYITFTLANYPEYAFGYDKNNVENFCLSSTDKSDNFKWTLDATEVASYLASCTKDGRTVTMHVGAPDNYTEGAITMRVLNTDGEVVTTVEMTKTGTEYTASAALEPGTYLFSAMWEGAPYATQIIYTLT